MIRSGSRLLLSAQATAGSCSGPNSHRVCCLCCSACVALLLHVVSDVYARASAGGGAAQPEFARVDSAVSWAIKLHRIGNLVCTLLARAWLHTERVAAFQTFYATVQLARMNWRPIEVGAELGIGDECEQPALLFVRMLALITVVLVSCAASVRDLPERWRGLLAGDPLPSEQAAACAARSGGQPQRALCHLVRLHSAAQVLPIVYPVTSLALSHEPITALYADQRVVAAAVWCS